MSTAQNHSTRKSSSGNVTLFMPQLQSHPSQAKGAVRSRKNTDVAGLSKAQLLELYGFLHETRRLEEHLVALHKHGKVVGGVFRSLGQEATAVGCAYAMREGDFVQPLIRDMGAMLVHGVKPIAMMRQYMAKATGPSGGRDLNQHFSDPEVGILGPVSMLGAMVPVLAGCLIASKHQAKKGEEPKAGLAFIGDGGSSTGAFYEGINFAAVKKLPLVMVIEANHYAYSTPTDHQLPGGDLLIRAKGFGCPVAYVDGNDPLACYEAARDARARGMAGEGPTIIVADTYRVRGHAEHDNQKYVPSTEISDWKKNNDPVDRFFQFLTQGKHLTAKAINNRVEEIESALDTARDTATAEALPDATLQTVGLFSTGDKTEERGGENSPWPATATWFRGGPAHRAAAHRAAAHRANECSAESEV